MNTRTPLAVFSRFGAVAALLALACVACPTSAMAQTTTLLTYFNFNDGLTSGQASGTQLQSDQPGVQQTTITTNFTNATDLQTIAGTVLNQATGDVTGAGAALSLRGGTNNVENGKYIQFTVSTTGFQSIVLSYATKGSSTGFTSQTLSYSTDGSTFTTFRTETPTNTATGTSANNNFRLVTAALPTDADNQGTITIRFTFDGATSSTGSNSLDNIQVTGVTAVPEPTTVFGGLLGVAGLCFHQRRRLGSLLRSFVA